MTKEELLQKIKEVEEQKFLNNMQDHWTRENYELNDKLYKELKELKKKLEEMKYDC